MTKVVFIDSWEFERRLKMGLKFSKEVDMDKPITKRERSMARRVQKTNTSKAGQEQKVVSAERTGILSLTNAKLTTIQKRWLEIEEVSLLLCYS